MTRNSALIPIHYFFDSLIWARLRSRSSQRPPGSTPAYGQYIGDWLLEELFIPWLQAGRGHGLTITDIAWLAMHVGDQYPCNQFNAIIMTNGLVYGEVS